MQPQAFFNTSPYRLDNRLDAMQLAMSRDERRLFANLNFSLQSGQMLVIEGANGSGKTTLLRILSGLLQADAGEVHWNGVNIWRERAIYQSAMSYLGHHNGLKLELTALENLRFAHALCDAPSQVDYAQCFDHVGLRGYEHTLVQALSAGQRRRLALARLLISGSPLWLMDEPLTALDARGVELVENLLAQHCEHGGMVVLSTHHRMSLATHTSIVLEKVA